MCGRFGMMVNIKQAAEQYGAKPKFQFEPSFNISPGQTIPAITYENEELIIEGFRWGFTPHWAKDPEIGMRMINARSESIHEKPAFRNAFANSRCLILATGFYEWKKEENDKVPYYIKLKDRQLFSFAGLWTTWQSEGKELKSCTIITTKPNSFVKDIHDRMPVILKKEHETPWLKSDTTGEELRSMLAPYPAGGMDGYQVSKHVNYPQNDSPELIRPVSGESRGLEDFFR